MIVYTGLEKFHNELKPLVDGLSFQKINTADDINDPQILSKAEVVLVEGTTNGFVKEIQKIYATDKYISIIVLAPPAHIKQVKQSIQFAPFIGNNVHVVTLTPELNLKQVLENAATRTKQKRSFQRLHIGRQPINQPVKKVKLAEMGSFLEYAPIGAMLVSESDKVINYNQQAKKLFPNLQLTHIEFSQLFTAKQAADIKGFIHSTHAPEEIIEIQNGNKYLELTSTEVYNEEGEKHFLLLFSDVTNERLESRRIELILEALPQMAWTTDAKGDITYFNSGWYFYTGLTKEESLQSGWISVVAEEDREKLLQQWRDAMASGKPYQHAARYRNAEGDYRWHLVRGSAVRDAMNRITMWVGTCTDIHDQVLLTEELEKKVRERTRSLELANIELEQFAHVSSHDLQEPLRKIRTFAEMLKDNIYETTDDNSKRFLDKITATAERMSDSLKALLNFTRVQNSNNFTQVDLNKTIAQILTDLELLIEQKGAEVIVDPLPVINAVPIQMQQLFYNLVHNGLKFSKQDEKPRIEIRARQLREEEIMELPRLQHFKQYHEITVKDNGIGFDQQYSEKIFMIFQRLHSKSEIEGTGIGLALARKVVINHGGEIYATSKPGEGTCFHIILPAD